MLTIVKPRPVVFLARKKSPLLTLDFFKNFPSDALREIEKHMIERKYARRESIFHEADPAAFIWFVEEGHVKEVHHSVDGKSHIICMVGADGMFGLSAFDGGNYGIHSVAETDSRVFSFPIQAFQVLMGRYPELARAVLRRISKLLRRSRDMQAFSQESAEKRLLHVLVEMVEEFGNVVPMTRREIAEMAGTAVETCIRIFSRLEQSGLMTSVHGKMIVKNPDSLKNLMREL